jgi:hypothetical protein
LRGLPADAVQDVVVAFQDLTPELLWLFKDGAKRRAFLSPFKQTYVCAVIPAGKPKFFLREATVSAKLLEDMAKRLGSSVFRAF